MDTSWIGFVADRLPELWTRTGEHLFLTGVSIGLAILAGLPMGIAAAGNAWLRHPLLAVTSVFQTIPSLAMLAILLALLNKIGVVPAIIALTLYALLPIVRNTLAGLDGVPPSVLEAARGIGMTSMQELWRVKIPLAMPVIVSGIRTAAVIGIGIATLSAFIGAGGLGQFINRGLALTSPPLLLLGAIPATILAILVDLSIGAAQWGMRPLRQSERGTFQAKLRPLALAAPLVLVLLGIGGYFLGESGVLAEDGQASERETIRVASKDFPEQFILGEMMAQMIEEKTNLRVERQFNLGGTMICHGALKSGEIDVYAEYSGTALTAILNKEVPEDPQQTLPIVREAYLERFDAEWLPPFGFNNTYAITVREDDARQYGWETISDLENQASELRAGFTAEFAEREDGYLGLIDAYNFRFGEVKDLQATLMYEALNRGEVDVIAAFATDGRIEAYDLKPLEDDHNFFPPYDAAPVIRTEILRAYPEVREALKPLAGLLNNATMQKLNFQVDGKNRSPEEAARQFLISHNLIKEEP